VRVSHTTSKTQRRAIPFWRDVRVLRVLSQVAFLLVVAAVAGFLYANLTSNLAERGLGGGFGFLKLEAGFEIGEGIRYKPSDSYLRAFWVGLVNTLKVSIWGIVLSTLLGIVVAVARLSSNWLVSRIALVYIEVMRNTPLLVQLFFWYFVGMVKGPSIQDSLTLPGPIYVSNRGVAMAWASPSATYRPWSWALLGGLLLAVAVYAVLRRKEFRSGPLSYPFLMALATLATVALLSYLAVALAAGQAPLTLEKPVLERFNYSGGQRLTPEFAALLLGLVTYTGAFIAEVVRGGIVAVQRGQREAARALGLSNTQVLRLIVFPQALRVIIPPLTSQYLNLAKNSSLAVAIGFADLYSVGGTIYNQAGKPLPVIVLIMGSYLAMSLITSLIMNLYNRRVQIVER
jgi:general L-amino acid transport system permease protein